MYTIDILDKHYETVINPDNQPITLDTALQRMYDPTNEEEKYASVIIKYENDAEYANDLDRLNDLVKDKYKCNNPLIHVPVKSIMKIAETESPTRKRNGTRIIYIVTLQSTGKCTNNQIPIVMVKDNNPSITYIFSKRRYDILRKYHAHLSMTEITDDPEIAEIYQNPETKEFFEDPFFEINNTAMLCGFPYINSLTYITNDTTTDEIAARFGEYGFVATEQEWKKTPRKTSDITNRYAFVFDYSNDGGWIIMLIENNTLKHYYNSDENDWEQSLDCLHYFLEKGGNRYEYKVATYAELNKAIPYDFIDEPPKDQPIEALEKYRVKNKD